MYSNAAIKSINPTIWTNFLSRYQKSDSTAYVYLQSQVTCKTVKLDWVALCNWLNLTDLL